ncbi:MAG: flagellar assembly protein FliW, partial [Tissierellia bacterium]|nr:flagellar assembly protein FliW [Tissierellia bacterium]
DYDVELSDEELLKIEIEHDGKEQLLVLTIVTLEETFKDSTTNLLAPIVVNLLAKKGKQFVLNDSIYATKHRLFPEGIGE